MERECIKSRGLHDATSGLEATRFQKIKTMSSLTGVEARQKVHLDEEAFKKEAAKERQRFAKQDLSIARSKKGVERTRAKLVSVKAKNQRIMQVRQELMKERATHGKVSFLPPQAKKA